MVPEDSNPPDPPAPTEGFDAPDWARVKELLADALELPTERRPQFLEQACGADFALRREVESLLPEAETADAFLETPVSSYFEAPSPDPGSQLGGYTLRGVLGEGGMGRVYEATQERPHRTVALKILRPGFLSPDAERRFQWEVEALGRLNHPSIAQVHDAGVGTAQDGRPLSWFAMELVHGEPLFQAVRGLELDREQRLQLFVRICDGIGHAHQRGIIHRDLKPENILVDQDAQPHILDFGIARAADPLASSVTTAGEVIGTLAYMAPEQLLGEPDKIDVRTDVYALGVILYRLLTGKPPIDLTKLPLPQVAAKLSNEDPAPASRHDRTLRGDLDTILEKALSREPDRRYPSVGELRGDVLAVLNEEPISARPTTTFYQLVKFARRNRTLVVGALATLAALVLAVVGTSVGMLRAQASEAQAKEDRDFADLQARRARAANAFLSRLIQSASPDVDGRDLRVVDLLDTSGAELIVDRTMEPEVRAMLHMELGKTYNSLGLGEQAVQHWRLGETLYADTEGASGLGTIEVRALLAEHFANNDRAEEARALLAQIRSGLEARESSPPWAQLRPQEVRAHLSWYEGDPDATVERYEALLAAWLEHEPAGSDTVEGSRNNLVVALIQADRLQDALIQAERAVEARTALHGPEHPETLTSRLNLATVLNDLGRPEAALAEYEELVPWATRIWGPEHPSTMILRNNLASSLLDVGRQEEAYEQFLELRDLDVASYPPDHHEVLSARNNVVVTAMALKRFDEAELELREVLTVIESAESIDDPVMFHRLRGTLAACLDHQGKYDESEQVSATVLAELETLLGEAHWTTLVERNNRALLLGKVDRAVEGVTLAERNLALARERQPDHPANIFPFQMNYGRTLVAAGRYPEAEVELLAVEAHVDADGGVPRRRIREELVKLYEAWNKPSEADRYRPDE